MDLVKFQQFQSAVDATFWADLGDLKLESLRLSEDALDWRPRLLPTQHSQTPGAILSAPQSLPPPGAPSDPSGLVLRGTLLSLNTLANLKLASSRQRAVELEISRLKRAAASEEALDDPNVLVGCALVVYCDLKSCTYHSWHAFPALLPAAPFALLGPTRSVEEWCGGGEGGAGPEGEARAEGEALSEREALSEKEPRPDLVSLSTACLERLRGPALAWFLAVEPASGQVSALSFREGMERLGAGQGENLTLACADCGGGERHPGWQLRSLLFFVHARLPRVREVRALCLRMRRGGLDAQHSIVLRVGLDGVAARGSGEGTGGDHRDEKGTAGEERGLERVERGVASIPALQEPFSPSFLDAWPKWVSGWEPTAQGKLAPRRVDLSSSMDPSRLAESAVELNLRLMRWRALPELDLEAIRAARCLLLGAGTLGCAVARTLLGWGVRDVTFVDSGAVSYSNPVRQSLYTLRDCAGGGQPKAEAAARALAEIHPGARAQGVRLSIPMPGHVFSDAQRGAARADAQALSDLMNAHDVVFLLTDTRESRWLPTLLGAAAARPLLVINAALGFDAYLVMRHGAAVEDEARDEVRDEARDRARDEARDEVRDEARDRARDEARDEARDKGGEKKDRPSDRRLGCYFCTDVVAPQDSTRDRSLDQQCTVTRPGLAPIAGALAAEVAAAVLQHPLGSAAPTAGAGAPPALGWPPHVLRGQLGSFGQVHMEGRAYAQCTACSETVVREYRRRGLDFVLEALESPSSIEDLTGLTTLHREAQAALEAMETLEPDEDEAWDAL